nr:hypothetical protein [Tanacetum cinerariifolium]
MLDRDWECRIVGQLLVDHALSYALTATADVPVVYIQQSWKTVKQIPNHNETIRFMVDKQEITYTVDMSCATLKLLYPRFTKPIIADIIKKYESIPKRLEEDYHSIKDDTSLKKKGKHVAGETSSPRPSLKVWIRHQKPSDTISPPSDDQEHDEIYEATLLSLAIHKTAKITEEQKNVAAVEEKILEEDVEKIIEGGDEESYASEFVDTVFLDEEDFGNRINLKSQKDNPKEVDDADDETKDEKKDDDADNKDDDQDDHVLIRNQRMVSSKIRTEKMQTPTPSPTRSPKKDLSSDKANNQESTVSVSQPPSISSQRLLTLLQQQLYLKMKIDLQAQVADTEIRDVMRAKFEKSLTSDGSCRDNAFRKRNHNDHQGDDAPPEGRKCQQQQKEWDAWVEDPERVHDFQLGIESYQIKINLTTPTLIFPGIEECDPFSTVDKPTMGLILLNNKNENRLMDLEELSKFCDATLEMEIVSFQDDAKYEHVGPKHKGDSRMFKKESTSLGAKGRGSIYGTAAREFPVIHPPPQETSIEILHDQENKINSVQTFLRKFNHYSFFEMPKVLLLAWDRVSKIKDAFGNKQYKPEDIQELFRELFNDVQNIHEELAEYINTPGWNRPSFYNNGDDDDEDYAIAITPDFLTTDSLIMRDKHLDTIPEKESDEFIKSSVEDLVPNPSEFEDECECDVPYCDDSQTTNFSMFSNHLFDDSTSSDDESSHEEVTQEMSFKTYSNLLFDLDEEIISKRLLHDDPIPLPDTLDFSIDVRVFLPFFTYPVTSLILLSSRSEHTIFDPATYHFSSLDPGVSHWGGTFMKFNIYPNHLNESPMEILSSTCSPMDQ